MSCLVMGLLFRDTMMSLIRKKEMHYNVSKLKSFQVFSVPNSEKKREIC